MIKHLKAKEILHIELKFTTMVVTLQSIQLSINFPNQLHSFQVKLQDHKCHVINFKISVHRGRCSVIIIKPTH